MREKFLSYFTIGDYKITVTNTLKKDCLLYFFFTVDKTLLKKHVAIYKICSTIKLYKYRRGIWRLKMKDLFV